MEFVTQPYKVQLDLSLAQLSPSLFKNILILRRCDYVRLHTKIYFQGLLFYQIKKFNLELWGRCIEQWVRPGNTSTKDSRKHVSVIYCLICPTIKKIYVEPYITSLCLVNISTKLCFPNVYNQNKKGGLVDRCAEYTDTDMLYFINLLHIEIKTFVHCINTHLLLFSR